jgi:hypothetical protein
MADDNQNKGVTAETITAIATNISSFMALWTMMTWRRLAMLSLFILLTIGGYTVWENRQNIYLKTIGRIDAEPGLEPIVLSAESKHSLIELVANDRSIEVLQVIAVDPYTNTRKGVFWAAKPGEVNDVMSRGPNGTSNAAKSREGVTLPLFSSDEEQNSQMVAVINNEFRCSSAANSGLVKIYPQIKDKLKISCRVPLPPNGLGKLRGYIAVHTNMDLNQFQLDQLRLLAVQTSLRIYYSDISRDTVTFTNR